MVYVLRDADGEVRVEYDRHIAGLFGYEDWIRFHREAGFQARAIPLEHSEVEPGSTYVFLGLKPNAFK